MRFKSRTGIIGLLSALLLAVLMVVPASAADGQLTVVSVTGTVNVKIFAVGGAGTTALQGAAVSTADPQDTKVGNTLYVSNKANAFSQVLVTLTEVTGATPLESNDTIEVAVKNFTTGTNINGEGPLTTLTLYESSTVNVFQGLFAVTSTGDADGEIAASDAQRIDVTYTSVAVSMIVDAKGPTVSNTAPVNNAIQTSTLVTFAGTVTDGGSGLRPDASPETGATVDNDGVNAEPLARASGAATDITIRTGVGGDATTGGVDESSLANFGWTAVTDGYSFVFNRPGLTAGNLYWSIEATDRTGNKTTTDVDGGAGTNNAYKLIIDNQTPQAILAEAGIGYNSAKKAEVADRKSIRVVFSNNGVALAGPAPAGFSDGPGFTGDFLNATTLAASDFRVDVSATDTTVLEIASITHPNILESATVTGVKNLAGVEIDTRHVVYITLANELIGNAKPRVNIIGNITDLAGNAPAPHAVTAADKILAKFTTTVTGQASTRPVSKGSATSKITVRVVSDEPLSTAPTAHFFTYLDADVTAPIRMEVGGVSAGITMTAVSGLTNTWETSQTNAVATALALVGVAIVGTDVNGNVATNGGYTPVAATKIPTIGDAADWTKADLFEFDNSVTAPTFEITPNTGGLGTTTESANPFLRVNFAEADITVPAESGDALTSKAFGTPPVTVQVDGHKGITLTKLTLDGVDMLASAGVVNIDSYVLSASGLAVGTHTLVVAGTDAVGNVSGDVTLTFDVIARKAYSVPLSPGWNLISLPGDPLDTAIDTVLPATHPATEVLSYDTKDPAGPWLVAVRASAGGAWSTAGTLKVIDGSKAYWVRTSTFAPISTLIPERSVATVLPTIPVYTGWNLVPASDLSQQKAGEPISTAATYFTSIDWAVAYQFDTQGNTWSKLLAGDNVVTAKGYWVWATKDGTFVP